MQPLRRPFGIAGRATDVLWPAWTGPASDRRRHRRPDELWETRPDRESVPGERVLADLDADTHHDDALLIMARYLVVRVARNAGRALPAFDPAIEAASAREYLDAIELDLPERRWLEAVLRATGRVSRTLVSRLNAAASAADRRGHAFGAFALRYTAWEIATRKHWHAEAARTARAIAVTAERGGGRRSRSLWSRRARVQEARAAR
jgi:hypothetical protein